MSATVYLERQIEAAIVAAVQTAVGTAIPVYGLRQPAAVGLAKVTPATHILVNTSSRSGSFTSRNIQIAATVSLMVAMEDDKGCDLFPDLEGLIINLIAGWNADDAAMTSALSIASAFAADAISFGEGADSGDDTALAVWFSIIPITVKGHLLTA